MKLKTITTFFIMASLLTFATGCKDQAGDVTTTATDAQQDTPAEGAETAEAPAEEAFYALGFAVSRNLSDFHLTQPELEQVERGLEDGVMGRESKVDLEASAQRIQELARERSQQAAEAERVESQKFLENAAAAAGAKKTDSGLIIKTTQEGTGPSPSPSDTVSVHYRGTLRDGKVFDSSIDRGQPVQFSLDQVIPCWSEGLQAMKVGGKAVLTCPPSLAYGDRPNGPIPAGSALQFEVELLDIVGDK